MGKDGSRAAKFRVGTRAKGGNRATASRKLKAIKHNGERHSEGFTGIAISHDHLIISQWCHFAFAGLATCLECHGRCRRRAITSPWSSKSRRTGRQVLLAHHRSMATYSAIWSRSVPYRRHRNPDVRRRGRAFPFVFARRHDAVAVESTPIVIYRQSGIPRVPINLGSPYSR